MKFSFMKYLFSSVTNNSNLQSYVKSKTLRLNENYNKKTYLTSFKRSRGAEHRRKLFSLGWGMVWGEITENRKVEVWISNVLSSMKREVGWYILNDKIIRNMMLEMEIHEQ